MKIKHTYNIITRDGTTSDIIDVVMNAYRNEDDKQIEELALSFKTDNDIETVRNVWTFLIEKIKYVADVEIQQIKSPARLIHDGTGDCKSYSILTACVLRYLNIDHFFRFVSYSTKKRATHVYVVAIIDNKEIPVDAVAYVQALRPFGTELKYNYKADMSEATTTIAYLAGVNDMGIGSVSDQDVSDFLNSERFDLWLNDDAESTLTQAKGYLLSEWDKEWSIYAHAHNTEIALEALNRLQYIGAMIRFYNENKNDTQMLISGGFAFDALISNSEFDTNEVNPQNRDFFSDAQHDRVLFLCENLQSGSAQFIEFWNTNIVEANTSYNDANGNILGIGSISELRTNLKKSGGYYLYSYIPDSDAQKYGPDVYRKRLIQKRLLELNKEVLTTSRTMTSAELENLVYSGCVNTWGSTPGIATNLLKARVGVDPATLLLILKVVAVAIGIIVTVINAIAKIKAVSEDTVKSGVPEGSEFNIPGTGGGSGSTSPGILQSGTSFILPLLLAGGLFLSKKKSNKK